MDILWTLSPITGGRAEGKESRVVAFLMGLKYAQTQLFDFSW